MIDNDDLGEYLTVDEMKSEDIINRVNELFMKQDKHISEMGNLYLATIKPGVVYDYDINDSFVGLIYSDNGWFEDYYIIRLYDVYINSDGSISGTLKKSSVIANSFEKLEQALSSNYEYKKLITN